MPEVIDLTRGDAASSSSASARRKKKKKRKLEASAPIVEARGLDTSLADFFEVSATFNARGDSDDDAFERLQEVELDQSELLASYDAPQRDIVFSPFAEAPDAPPQLPNDSFKRAMSAARCEPVISNPAALGKVVEFDGGAGGEVLIRPVNWHRLSLTSNAIRDPYLSLHREILDFTELLSPTTEEKEIRSLVLTKLAECVHSVYKNAKLVTFGSVATNLALPDSDIDVVCFCDSHTKKKDDIPNRINKIASKIQSDTDFAIDVERILTARIPLLKISTRFGIEVDLSFEENSGPENTTLITSLLKHMPEAKHLCLLVKYLLKARGLNETYRGGLGSFCVLLTVISVIQHAKRGAYATARARGGAVTVPNLGQLFVSYLETYGHRLQAEAVTISLKNGGTYKRRRRERFSRLCILNPSLSETHLAADVGKASFSWQTIKKVFATMCSSTVASMAANEPVLERLFSDENMRFLHARSLEREK